MWEEGEAIVTLSLGKGCLHGLYTFAPMLKLTRPIVIMSITLVFTLMLTYTHYSVDKVIDQFNEV